MTMNSAYGFVYVVTEYGEVKNGKQPAISVFNNSDAAMTYFKDRRYWTDEICLDKAPIFSKCYISPPKTTMTED